MTTEENKVAGCLILILAIPLTTIIRGWALKILWAWFVVPLGIMPIGMAHALGIAGTFQLLLGYRTQNDPEDVNESGLYKAVKSITISIFHSLIAVGFGWMIKQFMN